MYFSSNASFKILVMRSSQDMDNREIIRFAVHFPINMKVVKTAISDFVENVKDNIESCPGFPW